MIERQPLSDAKREALRKASAAAAEARRNRPPTEKELAARKRMQEGKARKAAERAAVRTGPATPVGVGTPDGPDVEPAPYPPAPVQAEAVAPAMTQRVADDLAENYRRHTAPSVPVEPAQTDNPAPKEGKSWLQKALGL